MPRSIPDTKSVGPWRQGIDNVAPQTALGKESLREAVNVELLDSGWVRRRPGYVKRYTGTDVHSLHSTGATTVFADGSSLLRLRPDYTTDTIRSDLTAGEELSYAVTHRGTYYSNSSQTGWFNSTDASPYWTCPTPAAPTISTVPGALPAGSYALSLTAYDSVLGESAAVPLQSFSSDGEQGVSVSVTSSSLPQYVYMTRANGTALYQVATVPAGDTSVVVANAAGGYGVELSTLDLEPLPAGNIVRSYRGQLWVATGSTLAVSRPMRPGLYDPAEDVFFFPEPITVLEPVDDGLYVVADRTYFLSGPTSSDMKLTGLDGDRGVPGTGSVQPSKYFKLCEAQAFVAHWFSERGPVIGLNGGQLINYAEGRLAMEPYQAGSSAFIERNGVQQLVTAVRSPGKDAALRATDSVVVEVRRHDA